MPVLYSFSSPHHPNRRTRLRLARESYASDRPAHAPPQRHPPPPSHLPGNSPRRFQKACSPQSKSPPGQHRAQSRAEKAQHTFSLPPFRNGVCVSAVRLPYMISFSNEKASSHRSSFPMYSKNVPRVVGAPLSPILHASRPPRWNPCARGSRKKQKRKLVSATEAAAAAAVVV